MAQYRQKSSCPVDRLQLSPSISGLQEDFEETDADCTDAEPSSPRAFLLDAADALEQRSAEMRL